MTARNVRRIIAINLLVLMILYFCLAIIHINYDCTHDDNCHICALINKVKDNLNGFDPNLTKLVITVLIFLSPVAYYLPAKITDKKKYTLVGLKVELIN